MKTINIITVISIFTLMSLGLSSCKSSVKTKKYDPVSVVDIKSGAQLWGENCLRCHNIPAPDSYNDVDWSTIELHMRVRANLTKKESDKIFDFLRSAN